jgi:replicative DNA helicase
MRLLAARADVNSHVMRSGHLSETALDKVRGVQGNGQIHLTSHLHRPSEIVAQTRQLQKTHGCGLLIIDYLQLLRPDGREQNREREVASIGDALKDAAISLDIPVMALVQLSRAPEGRPDRRPALSDLRDSGTLEQTADIVAFLYREEYYNPDKAKEDGHENLCQVIIGKHRDGPVGTVKARFDRRSGVWSGWDDGGVQVLAGRTPQVDTQESSDPAPDRGHTEDAASDTGDVADAKFRELVF